MARLLIIDNLMELSILEAQQIRNVKYKLYIPKAQIKTSGSRLIWSTRDGTDKIVLVTSDVIAVANLPPGEKVPASCVKATYFRI